jgi:protein ImuB
MNQALGRAREQIEPVRPAPPLRTDLMLDGPTDRWESIEAAVRHVLDDLAAQLARCGRGVRLLHMQLIHPHADAQRADIRLSRPSASVRHLWSLVRSRLERMDLGKGVEGIVLIASRTTHLRHEQAVNPALDVQTDHATEAAWGELGDTLVTRLGPQNIVRISPIESHLPERAFTEESIMEEAACSATALVTSADRPTMLLPRPEPAHAMALTPDGPVLDVGWRGRRWRVIACIGPERIGPEWWRWSAAGESDPAEGRSGNRRPNARRGHHPPPDRDYFAVQLESGQWLWVFRHVGTSRWFVHGQWS